MTASPAAIRSAWARAQILLNLGRADEAAVVTAEVAGFTQWTAGPVMIGGPRIFGLDMLPAGWCFLYPAACLAVVNDEVLDEFSMSACLFDFVRGADDRLDDAAFRRFDVASWRVLDQLS